MGLLCFLRVKKLVTLGASWVIPSLTGPNKPVFTGLTLRQQPG